MANITAVTDNNFKEVVLDSAVPVLIDFWAEWCAPCRLIAPIIDEISEEFKDKLVVVKLDVDNNPQISMN